jgi:hypothetical protein
MHQMTLRFVRGACLLLTGLLATAIWTGTARAAPEKETLPRFTEEREAASLFFVKKHLPELLPLLEQLKKSHQAEYEQEIRQIFQVSEALADLIDDPKRYELELKIWQTENRAHALVAKLSTPSDEERKKLEAQLLELARELVNLDIEVLQMRVEQLEREIGEAKDELAKARDQVDKQAKERYEALMDKAKRGKK